MQQFDYYEHKSKEVLSKYHICIDARLRYLDKKTRRYFQGKEICLFFFNFQIDQFIVQLRQCVKVMIKMIVNDFM